MPTTSATPDDEAARSYRRLLTDDDQRLERVALLHSTRIEKPES